MEWPKLVLCCLHCRLVWGTLPGLKRRISTICLGEKKPKTTHLRSPVCVQQGVTAVAAQEPCASQSML